MEKCCDNCRYSYKNNENNQPCLKIDCFGDERWGTIMRKDIFESEVEARNFITDVICTESMDLLKDETIDLMYRYEYIKKSELERAKEEYDKLNPRGAQSFAASGYILELEKENTKQQKEIIKLKKILQMHD